MSLNRDFRIAPDQATLTRSQQALMVLDGELRLVVYRGLVQLADPKQRKALLHTYRTEFGIERFRLPPIPEPRILKGRTVAPSVVAHLLVIDGRPVLWYEDDTPYAMAYAFALGRAGFEAAQRVSFRQGMAPPAAGT